MGKVIILSIPDEPKADDGVGKPVLRDDTENDCSDKRQPVPLRLMTYELVQLTDASTFSILIRFVYNMEFAEG